jgi:hypothetical protein
MVSFKRISNHDRFQPCLRVSSFFPFFMIIYDYVFYFRVTCSVFNLRLIFLLIHQGMKNIFEVFLCQNIVYSGTSLLSSRVIEYYHNIIFMVLIELLMIIGGCWCQQSLVRFFPN